MIVAGNGLSVNMMRFAVVVGCLDMASTESIIPATVQIMSRRVSSIRAVM